MEEATKMLNADRATLFSVLTTRTLPGVTMGEGVGEIRLPNNAGIAGTVFGKTMNIPLHMGKI